MLPDRLDESFSAFEHPKQLVLAERQTHRLDPATRLAGGGGGGAVARWRRSLPLQLECAKRSLEGSIKAGLSHVYVWVCVCTSIVCSYGMGAFLRIEHRIVGTGHGDYLGIWDAHSTAQHSTVRVRYTSWNGSGIWDWKGKKTGKEKTGKGSEREKESAFVLHV